MEFEVVIFTIITHSGEARSFSMEAIQYAKQGDFQTAEECLVDAQKKLSLAHEAQTSIIQAEAGGTKIEPSLLMIHAQDHLMNAITLKHMASEFVSLYKIMKTDK